VNHILFNLVAAAATAELLHAMMETFSARGKVKRLDAYIRNAPYKEFPVNVNTPIKVIGFAGTVFVVLFGASYLVISVLDLHGEPFLRSGAPLVEAGSSVSLGGDRTGGKFLTK
jgi:hypothetical protein